MITEQFINTKNYKSIFPYSQELIYFIRTYSPKTYLGSSHDGKIDLFERKLEVQLGKRKPEELDKPLSPKVKKVRRVRSISRKRKQNQSSHSKSRSRSKSKSPKKKSPSCSSYSKNSDKNSLKKKLKYMDNKARRKTSHRKKPTGFTGSGRRRDYSRSYSSSNGSREERRRLEFRPRNFYPYNNDDQAINSSSNEPSKKVNFENTSKLQKFKKAGVAGVDTTPNILIEKKMGGSERNLSGGGQLNKFGWFYNHREDVDVRSNSKNKRKNSDDDSVSLRKWKSRNQRRQRSSTSSDFKYTRGGREASRGRFDKEFLGATRKGFSGKGFKNFSSRAIKRSDWQGRKYSSSSSSSRSSHSSSSRSSNSSEDTSSHSKSFEAHVRRLEAKRKFKDIRKPAERYGDFIHSGSKGWDSKRDLSSYSRSRSPNRGSRPNHKEKFGRGNARIQDRKFGGLEEGRKIATNYMKKIEFKKYDEFQKKIEGMACNLGINKVGKWDVVDENHNEKISNEILVQQQPQS